MKFFLQRWLIPPNSDDKYSNFAFKALHYSLLVLILIVTLVVLIKGESYYYIVGALLISVLFLSLTLIHYRKFDLGATLFIGGLWIVVNGIMIYHNGLFNSVLVAHVLLIVFASILFSRRTVIVLTALSSTAVMLIGFLQSQNIVPLNTISMDILDRVLANIAVFLSTGILLARASKVIREALDESSEARRILEERNRQLEQEIAERHRVEVSLRLSEETYRLLFENASIWAGMYDTSGRVIMLNQAAAAVFGQSPEAMKGKSLFDMFSEKDAASALARQQRVIQTGVTEVFEGTITLPGGREISYLRHVIPIPNPNTLENKQAGCDAVMVLTTDLTEQKIAEQRSVELLAMQEKNDFFTDFFGTISHDIKTPLSVMNTSLYLLEHSPDPDKRLNKVNQIKDQLSLLEQYIQDMLMFSRLEHAPTFKKTTVYINELIEEIVGLLLPRCEKKQIECQMHLQNKLKSVIADREQLRRAIINLLENAINYTPSTGSVQISTEAYQSKIVIKIEDSGIGIPPEDMPHIFERFYRAPEARVHERSGTGLGLAIVKKIVDMHEGHIEVESKPDRGSKFEIHLPL